MTTRLVKSQWAVVALFCAMAAVGVVATAASDSRAVTFLPAASVDAAFAKGVPMLETPGYKIHASRREAPGMAEIHTRDTDILYVRQGTATVVTGGEVVDAKTTGPDELRGVSIRGGEKRQLSPGDVMVIPNGVPHQFVETSNPFLYYVVKATSSAAMGGTR